MTASFIPEMRAMSNCRRGFTLRLVATIFAIIGQLGVSGASLTLAGDESSTVSHTEQRGVDLHHGHNEATCPACIGLSLHGTVAHGPAPVNVASISTIAPARRADSFVAGPQLLPNSCRAPPREA